MNHNFTTCSLWASGRAMRSTQTKINVCIDTERLQVPPYIRLSDALIHSSTPLHRSSGTGIGRGRGTNTDTGTHTCRPRSLRSDSSSKGLKRSKRLKPIKYLIWLTCDHWLSLIDCRFCMISTLTIFPMQVRAQNSRWKLMWAQHWIGAPVFELLLIYSYQGLHV